MMRVLFLTGLTLLLVASASTVVLATRAAPRQGLVAEVPPGALAGPDGLGPPLFSVPTPTAPGGAVALWVAAGLLMAVALGAALLVLRPANAATSPTPSAVPGEPSLPPTPPERPKRWRPPWWAAYLLLFTLIGVVGIGVLSLLGSRVSAVFSTISSGLGPAGTVPASLPIMPAAPLLTVTVAEAAVYAEPREDSQLIAVIRPGDQVYAHARTPNGQWVAVGTRREHVGWAWSRYLALTRDQLIELPVRGGDAPSQTAAPSNGEATTPSQPGRSVIRADWPGRLEVGQPDTVTVRLLSEEVLAHLPTVDPARSAVVTAPTPVGTPQASLPRAFGAGYTACATATLRPELGLHTELLTPPGCLPIDTGQVTWTWRVTAPRNLQYALRAQIDVTWTPIEGGTPITRTVWGETLFIRAERVLVGSGPLRALSLASAGLGVALTAPLAYRRGRERWLEQGTVAVPFPAQVSPEAPAPQPVVRSDSTVITGSLRRRKLSDLLPPWPAAAPPQPPAPHPEPPPVPHPEPPPAPHLNTEFTGVAAREPLRVGQVTPLLVWVGERVETAVGRSSRPFAFALSGQREPVAFDVRVDGDPECWRIEARNPRMVVRPPGSTDQAAVFRVTALKAGTDKLYLTVTQTATGAAVQHVWLPVTAVEQAPAARPAAGADEAVPAAPRAVRLPLDTPNLKPRQVRLTISSGRDPESFTVVVDAELPGGRVHQIYGVPVSATAVQNATLRLRQELERIVLFAASDDGTTLHPFADPYRLTVDAPLARQAAAPLADAGQQVWHLLFNAPRAPAGLRRFGAALRDLPHGSALQVVIESQQFILPWALLYDQPGEITPDTLDWSGFWGYRYILDVLPPGDYPEPQIDTLPPDVWLLFNDDPQLRRFTEAQERFMRDELGIARAEAAWGASAVRQALAARASATLLYIFCHGQHESGAARPGALPSESALTFGPGDRVRLADMRRILPGPLGGRPLVFLNACEGATQDAFYYDGFMPFFIEECGARGFIGAEVKTPQLLAHDLALRFMRLFAGGVPVGEALWRLRRAYLDEHNNPLAFNYTLYGLDEVRLARPLER